MYKVGDEIQYSLDDDANNIIPDQHGVVIRVVPNGDQTIGNGSYLVEDSRGRRVKIQEKNIFKGLRATQAD